MDLKWFLFSFEGRIPRKQYWGWQFVLLCACVLLITMAGGIENIRHSKIDVAFGLVALWPSLAVKTKRWHDRGKSAWWLLLSVIPVVGVIWSFIETGCLAGEPCKNKYGPNSLSKE